MPGSKMMRGFVAVGENPPGSRAVEGPMGSELRPLQSRAPDACTSF
jgi:hypothetical protein